MNNRFFAPLILLAGVLFAIFICSLYICGYPGTAQAEEGDPCLAIADNPYGDDAPVETEPASTRWYELQIPRSWSVTQSNGAEFRALGPAGANVWVRIAPDGRRMIWALNYHVRTRDGQLRQRVRVGGAELTERTDNPEVMIEVPAECTTIADCESFYTVEVNWPFADEHALQQVEDSINWLTQAIQRDTESQKNEALEAAGN